MDKIRVSQGSSLNKEGRTGFPNPVETSVNDRKEESKETRKRSLTRDLVVGMGPSERMCRIGRNQEGIIRSDLPGVLFGVQKSPPKQTVSDLRYGRSTSRRQLRR